MKTRLRYWRRQRVMTQQDLASAAGVSNQTIVNIERYGKEPTITTIRKLIGALNISPSELFTEDPEQADGLDEESVKRSKKPAA